MASLLMAEFAARLKAEGKTLHQRLDELFVRYGCHMEGQINVQMPGEQGIGRHESVNGQVPHGSAAGAWRHEAGPRAGLP